MFKNHPFFIRLFHWEYWPFNVVYGPIYLVWFWFGFRARSLFFFSSANPSIKNGGFVMESKLEIDALLPKECRPATWFFKANTSFDLLQHTLTNLTFPAIVKPDIGMQGLGVQKVQDWDELKLAAAQSKVDFVVQPFVDFANELGVFYVRHPLATTGKITGIVSKQFVKVVGDGHSNLRQLLAAEPRYILQLPAIEKMAAINLLQVPALGEIVTVVPFGNHARGCLFEDATHWATPVLQQSIDALCRQIPGFYYGRLDIKYNSLQDLEAGKNFAIIELNGAGSEPTHMYDPRHSIFFAWKEIVRHWYLLHCIAKANHALGHKYMSWKEGRDMFKAFNAYQKVLRS